MQFFFLLKKARESGDYRKDKVLTARNAGGYKSNIFNNTSPFCVFFSRNIRCPERLDIYNLNMELKCYHTYFTRCKVNSLFVAEECNIF